jgi:hypothetical protein
MISTSALWAFESFGVTHHSRVHELCHVGRPRPRVLASAIHAPDELGGYSLHRLKVSARQYIREPVVFTCCIWLTGCVVTRKSSMILSSKNRDSRCSFAGRDPPLGSSSSIQS